MNLMKIALSNIRRRKSAALTFLVMMLISALMLCIALNLSIGMQTFYDEKHRELKGSHYMTMGPPEVVTEFVEEQIKTSAYVQSFAQKPAYLLVADLTGTSQKDVNYIFLNANDFADSKLLPLHYIEAAEKIPAHGIVLPYAYKSSGIKVGDSIKFQGDQQSYSFEVYAFFEDIELGASTISMNKIYVFDDAVQMLAESDDFVETGYLTLQLKDPDQLTEFRKSIVEPPSLSSITFELTKSAGEVFVTIMSLLLLAFFGLVILISLVVVRFNLVTSMEEDIINIGALKSIGYTNNQLIRIQLLQYGLIAFCGCLIGSVISIFCFPMIGNVIASTTGLLWGIKMEWLVLLLPTTLIVCLCELLILLIAQRVRRTTPINAMRQGDSGHSFKKNYFPLSKNRFPLLLHLAGKQLAQSLKMNLTLLLVLAALCYMSAIVGVMNYNMDHPQAFYDMVGLEDSDYMIAILNDFDQVAQDLAKDPEVAETVYYGVAEVIVNNVAANGLIYEDFSKSKAKDLYDGRKPWAENEIAVGLSIAAEIEKTIGDTVTVEAYGKKREYLIVGLVQGLSDGGRSVLLPLAGMQQHQQETALSMAAITLRQEVNQEAFSQKLTNRYGSKIMLTSYQEMMENVFSSMETGIRVAVAAMLSLSVFIVAFVLFLLVNGIIRKEKKNFGIMKACGYTNQQIRNQVLLSYLPSIVLGSTLGAICSGLFTNTLLSVMFHSAGLNKTFFIVPMLQNIVLCTLLGGAAVLVILAVCLRIKHISPHKLITE